MELVTVKIEESRNKAKEGLVKSLSFQHTSSFHCHCINEKYIFHCWLVLPGIEMKNRIAQSIYSRGMLD